MAKRRVAGIDGAGVGVLIEEELLPPGPGQVQVEVREASATGSMGGMNQ